MTTIGDIRRQKINSKAFSVFQLGFGKGKTTTDSILY